MLSRCAGTDYTITGYGTVGAEELRPDTSVTLDVALPTGTNLFIDRVVDLAVIGSIEFRRGQKGFEHAGGGLTVLRTREGAVVPIIWLIRCRR